MRAMLSETPGGPESLKLVELPSKPLGKGQVRVAVRAAGVNFPDTLIIADKYQFKPPRPFAPGHEIAGDIVELGEGVTGYKKGDRVIGMIGHGGYATEAVVDVGQLLPMPDNMSYEDGSAFTMTYGTSYYALKQRSSYKPGETLLVTGASGGVGLTAVELGALMGLKVIAAVGSDEKMDVCRKYGATMFVNYAKEKMRDKVKELTSGNGADIIYDAVGGDAFDESVRCIAWYGRLLVVGFAAGRIPSLPANLALLKSCDVRGVFYGAWRGRTAPADQVADIVRGIEELGLLPRCDALLTGYVGDAALADVVLDTARRVRAANARAVWCCDPVLGDVDTGIYVKAGIDTFFRERAIPAADLVTPNHFELEHLTGRKVSTMDEALAAARSLLNGPRLALITSLRRADAPADSIEMVAVSPEAAWRIATPLIGFEVAPNGTGDAVAALFSAHWIESGDVALALGKAASSIFAVLEATRAQGERELQLVAAQDRMVAPSRHFTAEKL